MLRIQEKLAILAQAAKYDVSCSSSGAKRSNPAKQLGNSDGIGICHSYTEDGRCVSLLKILLTNHCIYDCAYCISRKSHDIARAAFTVEEVVDLTINFYRRNYIEGLFLSSGIFKSADFTMERLVLIAKKLRTEHRFNGYIHLKAIPGASDALIKEAGLYADRLSVNIELPTEQSLKHLAPEKDFRQVFVPMNTIKNELLEYQDARKHLKTVPKFASAGQSTQLIVGATHDNDRTILKLASGLYQEQKLKRVYYSGYVPVLQDSRLPTLATPPLLRENRIYQADWLMRFYGFDVDEILPKQLPFLETDIDPKLAWALRNPALFPVEIQTADRELLIRVPGIGRKSADLIVKARRFNRLDWTHLKSMGVVLKRAKYFITCQGKTELTKAYQPEQIRTQILQTQSAHKNPVVTRQLSLF